MGSWTGPVNDAVHADLCICNLSGAGGFVLDFCVKTSSHVEYFVLSDGSANPQITNATEKNSNCPVLCNI